MSSVVATDELNYWEKIVGQLANRPDFKDESCFYMVDGLYDVEKDEAHEIRNGVYDLKPSHEYELRIYHYLPTSPTKTVYLHLRASKPSVEFMSNPVQVIDSRYDMKRIRFRTGLPTCQEISVHSLFRSSSYTNDAPDTFDFDLRLSTSGCYLKLLVWGTIVGILLAAPHVIGTLSSQEWILCVVYILIGLITGVLAAFKLRPSL